jgi:hypothetical protein
MSFWGKIFGTENAINTTISAVKDGLDALVYTDEEKAGDAAKERTQARSMVVDWMQATQGQNLARRLIALSVTTVWLAQYVMSLIGSMIIPWLDADAEQWVESVTAINDSAAQMNSAMMLILAFYFAAPHMGDIAKAALNGFGKK